MAIAQIAYDNLDSEAKFKADSYLKAVSSSFPDYGTFITASLWADDISHAGIQSFFPWHISPHPFDPEGFLSESELEKIIAGIEANNIVWMMRHIENTLKSPQATPWAKGFMLRFLIHLIGDIHQPMHCVSYYSAEFPMGDWGGNRFTLKHEKYSSLHKLFDSAFGLCDLKPHNPLTRSDKAALKALVKKLTKDFPVENFAPDPENAFDSWRQESYDLATTFAYKHFTLNEEIPPDLMIRGQKLTAERLALAGYRLAHMLNSCLK